MPFVRLEGPPGAADQGGSRKFVVLEKSKDPRASHAYRAEKAKAKARDEMRAKDMKFGLAGFGGEGMGALMDSIMPLPVGDEIRGGMFAAGNAVANVGRKMVGKPTVDSEAIYLANKDAENEFVAERNRKHPVANVVGSVLGGAAAKPVQAAGAVALPLTRSLAEKAAAFGANAGKAAGAGGMFSSLYGFADGEGAGDRVERAADAFLPGAAAGAATFGLVSAAAPVVRKAPGLIRDLARTVTTRPPPPGVRAKASPKQAEQAARAVDLLAQRRGLTAETARQLADDTFKGKPVTAAELLGREGVTQLAATARRAGSTGDELEGLLRARQQGAGPRILEDFADDLGVSPGAAHGSIDDIVEQGQAAAKPLYDRALGDQQPVWNNELHGLAQRPVVRDAIKAARASIRNAGGNPDAMGLADVELPGAWDSSFAPGMDDVAEAASRVRGPASAPSRGPSLLKFIADGQGISDAADELAAVGGQNWHRGRAYQRTLQGDGGTLDDWALRAQEAGYLAGHNGRPTERELLDAIAEEMAGRPTYARQADPMAQQRFDGREAADELAYRGGDPADLPDPDQYVGRPAPRTEPAYQVEPTAKAWDHVKKALDALVERDPMTGKVIYSGEKGLRNRDLAQASRDMKLALAGTDNKPGAIPGYKEALDVSGDYLGVQSAFNRAKGLLTRGSVRDFGKVWASAKTQAEQRAIRSAVANDVLRLAEAGHLRGGKFAVPGIEAKLQLAFGRKGASEFLAKMEAEAALARTGQRMMPGAGSPTMELADAAGDPSGALMDATRIGGKVARGQPGGALADLFTTAVQKSVAYARTSGMPVEVRDEYGRLLSMGADELVTFLRTRTPTAIKGPEGQWYLPGTAGGMVGAHIAAANQR